MSEYKRVINRDKPENKEAMRKANAAIAAETGGKKLSMGPKDAALRKKWMNAYIAAGGEYKVVKTKGKRPKETCLPCQMKKTVTAKIHSVTFRSDHVRRRDQKVLRPSSGNYKDANSSFQKPEWQADPRKSDPISHTKNENVEVDIEVDVSVFPLGFSAQLSKVKGTCADRFLTFEKDLAQTVRTEVVPIRGLVSKGKLPNYVDLITGKSITWSVVVDGKPVDIGTTGSHKIYVTYSEPRGKMIARYKKEEVIPGLKIPGVDTKSNVLHFEAGGQDQHVTEERLAFSVDAARRAGRRDEKECVDAVFVKLKRTGVTYAPKNRWEPGPKNDTGVDPKPKLHEYLWMCNARKAKGECHNIAAAFILACQILGVKGRFEVGHMNPWPSRKEWPHDDEKRPGRILGKYNKIYWRKHRTNTLDHKDEFLQFLDSSNFPNTFEGVARYRNVLYAIGEGKYDLYNDPDKNASTFFAKHTVDRSTGRVSNPDFSQGQYRLIFQAPQLIWRGPRKFDVKSYWCTIPYPGIRQQRTLSRMDGKTITCTPFYWHD